MPRLSFELHLALQQLPQCLQWFPGDPRCWMARFMMLHDFESHFAVFAYSQKF